MAKVCANHLAQAGIARYAGSFVSTKLKVTGIDVFSVGEFAGGADTEEIVLSDPGAGVYRKLVLRNDRLVGGVLYGDTADGAWYLKLLRELCDTMLHGSLSGPAPNTSQVFPSSTIASDPTSPNSPASI